MHAFLYLPSYSRITQTRVQTVSIDSMHTFLYACKHTFGGGLTPSCQTMGTLLRTPGQLGRRI